MIKLPEGIGFTAEDFFPLQNQCGPVSRGDTDGLYEDAARAANAKLPALFEAWVRQEGVKVFGFSTIGSRGNEMKGDRWLFDTDHGKKDTHQAYLVLRQEIKK